MPALVAPHVAWTTPVLGRSRIAPSLPLLFPGIIGADGVIHLQVDPDSFSIDPDGSIRTRTSGGGIPAAIGADGALYIYGFGSNDLSALRPDGSVQWTMPDVFPGMFTLGDDGAAYVLADDDDPYCATGSVIAIRPDGSALWTVPAPCSNGYPATISSPAVGADGTLYFASDTEDHVLPSAHVEAVAASGTVRWRNGDTGVPLMVGLDGTLYASGADQTGGGVIAYGADGSHRWETNDTGSLAAEPDGDVLLLADDGGPTLYDFHPDGSMAWASGPGRANSASAHSGNPTVVDGAIYVTTICYPNDVGCTSGITALSSQGEPLWAVGGFNPVWMIVGKSAIYALSVDVHTWDFTLVGVSD